MSVTLEVRAASDMEAARADVGALGDAYRQLGSDVDVANSATETAGSAFDAMGESSDNLASRASQATGAFGALAGGLEAVGATGAADALNNAAIATDAMSGAGDLLNLVVETQVGQMLLQKGAMVASTVATGAMTAAQTALNAVMALNPIALVVIAVAALTAGVILAYKNSETFRNIVDGAFTKAKEVIGGAADAVADFIDWLEGLPADAREAWDKVSGAVGDAVEDAQRFFGNLIDDVKQAPADAVSAVAGSFTSMFSPILDAIGWVQDLIDKIKSIDFPDLPDWPFRQLPGGDGNSLVPTTGDKDEFLRQLALQGWLSSGPMTVSLKAEEQDKDRAMALLVEALRDYFARNNMTLSLTEE